MDVQTGEPAFAVKDGEGPYAGPAREVGARGPQARGGRIGGPLDGHLDNRPGLFRGFAVKDAVAGVTEGPQPGERVFPAGAGDCVGDVHEAPPRTLIGLQLEQYARIAPGGWGQHPRDGGRSPAGHDGRIGACDDRRGERGRKSGGRRGYHRAEREGGDR